MNLEARLLGELRVIVEPRPFSPREIKKDFTRFKVAMENRLGELILKRGCGFKEELQVVLEEDFEPASQQHNARDRKDEARSLIKELTDITINLQQVFQHNDVVRPQPGGPVRRCYL